MIDKSKKPITYEEFMALSDAEKQAIEDEYKDEFEGWESLSGEPLSVELILRRSSDPEEGIPLDEVMEEFRRRDIGEKIANLALAKGTEWLLEQLTSLEAEHVKFSSVGQVITPQDEKLRQELLEWSAYSLASAWRDDEDEFEYTLENVK